MELQPRPRAGDRRPLRGQAHAGPAQRAGAGARPHPRRPAQRPGRRPPGRGPRRDGRPAAGPGWAVGAHQYLPGPDAADGPGGRGRRAELRPAVPAHLLDPGPGVLHPAARAGAAARPGQRPGAAAGGGGAGLAAVLPPPHVGPRGRDAAPAGGHGPRHQALGLGTPAGHRPVGRGPPVLRPDPGGPGARGPGVPAEGGGVLPARQRRLGGAGHGTQGRAEGRHPGAAGGGAAGGGGRVRAVRRPQRARDPGAPRVGRDAGQRGQDPDPGQVRGGAPTRGGGG